MSCLQCYAIIANMIVALRASTHVAHDALTGTTTLTSWTSARHVMFVRHEASIQCYKPRSRRIPYPPQCTIHRRSLTASVVGYEMVPPTTTAASIQCVCTAGPAVTQIAQHSLLLCPGNAFTIKVNRCQMARGQSTAINRMHRGGNRNRGRTRTRGRARS